MPMNNVDEKTILDFLRQSIEQLQAVTPPTDLQWRPTTLERTQGGHHLRPTTKPDFDMIIWLEHSRLPAIENFAEALEADARYQRIQRESNERFGGLRLYLALDQIAVSVLRDYVRQLDQLRYDEQWAIRIASNFLRSLDDGMSRLIVYSVIRGLECDFECHTLPGDIQLRRLKDEEIIQLLDATQPGLHERNLKVFDLYVDDNLASNRCLVEQRLLIPFLQGCPDLNAASEKFDKLVTALRLLKEGRVERQITRVRSECPGQLALTGWALSKRERHPISNTYSLSEADLPALMEILRFLQRGSIPVQLRTAVDRTNFAAERHRPDDQLLDILIAMEAIYGDEAGAIGYKIGLRCAVFVETDYEKREHIRKLINDAYKRRSALVHGGRKSKSDLELTTGEMVEELLLLIRESIKRIAKQLLSGEGVPKSTDFDKMLLQPA